MAPRDSVPTPNSDVAFAAVKTPEGDDKRRSLAGAHTFGKPSWTRGLGWFGNLAQVVILASIFVYIVGQLLYFSATNSDLKTTIGIWYGVPEGGGKNAGGHGEMVRPTYFFLFCLLPIGVSLLLFEFLRHFNVRRISSHYVLSLARVLRRKPRVFDWVARVSLGELLFLAFLLGGNIHVFQYYYRKRVAKLEKRGTEFNLETYLEMFGLTFGFVCCFNMAFLFLPATRNCVWMEFLNMSYANGIKYHRWVGVITVVTASLHCIGYYGSWIKEGIWADKALPCFDCDLGSKQGHKPWMNVFGEIALLCFLAIGFTSIPWMRRKMYNTFYLVHHLFLFGVIFTVMHWKPSINWIFPSFLLYVVNRALSSSNAFTPVPVREFTTLGQDVVKVVLARSTARAGDFKTGQFVYLNVPAISKLQWHAFTIGSSPRSSPDSLTILLKNLGDWTEDLVKYSEECKENNVLPTVYMDGYYGGSLEMYDEYATVCLVGGGIGVTPLFAILEDMVAKLRHGASLNQKVYFIFTFRELSLLEEIHPLLMQMKELDPQEQYFSLHFSLTRTPTDQQLDQPIDYKRLAGTSHVAAVKYDSAITKASPQPFAEPLRSGKGRSLVFFVSFLLALLVMTILEYGSKLEAKDRALWPLQNFAEISLLIVIAALAVYVCTLVESKMRKPSPAFSGTVGTLETPKGLQPYMSDVHTYRDLLTDYRVAMGERPSMHELMQEVFDGHQQFKVTHPTAAALGNPAVGVFISGPDALKKATEYAMADIGSRHFDMHEEEFEL